VRAEPISEQTFRAALITLRMNQAANERLLVKMADGAVDLQESLLDCFLGLGRVRA